MAEISGAGITAAILTFGTATLAITVAEVEVLMDLTDAMVVMIDAEAKANKVEVKVIEREILTEMNVAEDFAVVRSKASQEPTVSPWTQMPTSVALMEPPRCLFQPLLYAHA